MKIIIMGSFDDTKRKIAVALPQHDVKRINYGQWEDKKLYYSYDMGIYIERSGHYRVNINHPRLFKEPGLSEVLKIVEMLNKWLPSQ